MLSENNAQQASLSSQAKKELLWIKNKMREEGLKWTSNRKLVLEKLLEEKKSWSLNSLHLCVQKKGLHHESTVYRILEALKEIDVVEEFQLPGTKVSHYAIKERSDHHHHHHISCQNCDEIIHLHQCLPQDFLIKIQAKTGFKITEHRLEFKGLCKSCGAK